MNQMVALIQVLGLSLAVVASGWAAEANPDQAKSVAEVEQLGGSITVDEKNPDRPVIGVYLQYTKVTDAVLGHLKALTNLKKLDLLRTEVTDAGLEQLKGLTNLKDLNLRRTKLTDAGLEHLKGLTNLEDLDLRRTRVTDAGLANLKGLTRLQSLYLWGTEVSNAGVQGLQTALPKCSIHH